MSSRFFFTFFLGEIFDSNFGKGLLDVAGGTVLHLEQKRLLFSSFCTVRSIFFFFFFHVCDFW